MKGGEKKRGEASPLSFPGRRGVAAELSQGHTTHIASNNAESEKKKEMKNELPLPPSIPSSLSTAYMSISLTAAAHQHSHQSLSVCLAGKINGPSLRQVLMPLQSTRLGPPD